MPSSAYTECEDEYGAPWIVYKDDPAHEHIKTLVAAGFSYIVLKRETLHNGILTEVTPPVMEGGTLSEEIKPLVLRRYRLYDCWHYLVYGDSFVNPAVESNQVSPTV